MIQKQTIKQRKPKRVARIRSVLKGTEKRPRLVVFRSHAYVYAQVVNDDTGITLGTIREKGKNIASGKTLGAHVVDLCKKKSIKEVVYDRSGNKYHGVIKTIADAVREGGVKI